MAITGLGNALAAQLKGGLSVGRGGGEHTVGDGETIEGIAQQHGLRPAELLAANLDLVKKGEIKAGDTLKIPAKGEIGEGDLEALMGILSAKMANERRAPPPPRSNAGQKGGATKAQPQPAFNRGQMYDAPSSTPPARTGGGGGGGSAASMGATAGGAAPTSGTPPAGTAPAADATTTAAPATAQPGGSVDIQDVAQRYAGGSYVYGGGRDGKGFGVPGMKSSDCSAFVSAVWAEKGLPLAAHTDGAYNQLKKAGAPTVPLAEAKPGDIVFYMGAGTGGAISHHVGIYAGNGKVLDQSSSNGGGVQLRDLNHGGRFEIVRDPRMG